MKIAEILIDADGPVISIRYRGDAPNDVPDLTGLMPNLIPEMVAKLGYAHKPVIYLDSHGVWDEVVLNQGEFAGFRTLGSLENLEEAKTRALQLREAMRQAEGNETLTHAINVLKIFKDKDGTTRPSTEDGNGPMSEEKLIDRLADGLFMVAMAKLTDAHNEVLANVLDAAPADRRSETFAILDRVRREWKAVLIAASPKIRAMATQGLDKGVKSPIPDPESKVRH